MKSHSRVMVLAVLSASSALAAAAWSQADSSAHLQPVGAAPATAPATAPDTAAHKHGMFGKLKGFAKNKTVQSIAKAAVCTAVPGGQYVVGAVDAAHANGVSASSLASGVTGSSSCIPGMGGLGAGLGSKGLATAGAAGAVGLAAAQAGSLMQSAAMNGSIGAAPATGTAGAAITQTAASMQAMMTQMQSGAAASGAVPTEAAGQQIQLSGTPAAELKKGKLVIKHIDWMRGSPGVSAPTMSGFVDLLTTIGQAMKETGGTYRVDIYMDKQYSDADIAAIAPQRVGMILSVLQDRVQAGDVTIPGNIKKDKEQRVEILKIK